MSIKQGGQSLEKNKKYGFIDKKGEEVVAPEYKSISLIP
jgi:hypothetical protein